MRAVLDEPCHFNAPDKIEGECTVFFKKEKQVIELEQQKKDAITAEKSKRQKAISIAAILGFILVSSLGLVVFSSFIQKRKANNILTMQKLQIEEYNEELLVQKEEIQNFAIELEKANKTKDKFFSIIAHDLKSPLGALMGFSDLLLKKHATYDIEKRETYIKFIKESSIKTLKLLDNLLTWAQSQTGVISFIPEIINVSELISEIFSLLEESAENKEIKLIFYSEREISVEVDKNMLDTVIRNLISNAIKFTPKKGNVTVKAETLRGENNQEFVEISVKDNGSGIPEEIKDKIFQPFFTTKAEGSKLRAEVKRLRQRVELMKKRESDTLAALKKAKGEMAELKGLVLSLSRIYESPARLLVGVSLIVDTDVGAPRRQEPRHRKTAPSESDDHRVLSGELHRHLNFSVARLNTASMIAIIQKRTMTRGSGQPFSSK